MARAPARPGLYAHDTTRHPTLRLLRGESCGHVRFSELSPLAFRLVQRLGEAPGLSGRAQLEALAQEAGSTDPAGFIEQGRALLEQMRDSGVVLGSQRTDPQD